VYAYVGNNPTNRTDYRGLMLAECRPGEPCHREWPPYSYEPTGEEGGQEENDQKPCPKKPEDDGQKKPDEPGKPDEPVTPPDPCDQFCSQYTDEYENAACRAGCDAGRHGLPNDPTCEIMGSQYGDKAKEACEAGYGSQATPRPKGGVRVPPLVCVAAAGATALDGPLPFGDCAGGVLIIGGMVCCAIVDAITDAPPLPPIRVNRPVNCFFKRPSTGSELRVTTPCPTGTPATNCCIGQHPGEGWVLISADG
jgi:hypothetical protein